MCVSVFQWYTLWGQVVDARSSSRFKGEVPEPRPSLPSGGMKGGVNLHYSRLLDAQRGTVKTRSLLASGHYCTLSHSHNLQPQIVLENLPTFVLIVSHCIILYT